MQSKYAVRYKGELMSLGEFAKRNGMSGEVLRTRAKSGGDFYAPLSSIVPIEDGLPKGNGGYANGYTFEELAELYKFFEGQEDEICMVMDFTGLRLREAKKLLEKLRFNAAKNRKGYQA